MLVLLLLLFGCAGMRCLLLCDYFEQRHIIRYCRDEPRLATLRGRVISDPYTTADTSTFSAFNFMREPATIFQLRCEEVLTTTGWQEAQGLLQVYVSPPVLRLQIGQEIQVQGWLAFRRGPNNPGQFDATNIHRASRILASLKVNTVEAVQIQAAPPKGDFWTAIRHRVQRIAETALLDDADYTQRNPQYQFQQPQNIATPQNIDVFLRTLLMGQRYQLSDSINEMFVRNGTIHFLAISGLHLGLFMVFIWRIVVVAGLLRPWQAVATLIMLALFLLLVPLRPPILRAAILTVLFCLSFITERKGNILHALSWAVIFILLWRPLDLFNAGFQLSFVVSLAIVTLAVPIYRLTPSALWAGLRGRELPIAVTPTLLWIETPWQRWKHRIKQWVWALFIVCLVAWIAGLALLAWHFNRIPLWAVPASFVLAPFISITLLFGFTQLILVGLIPSLQPVLLPVLRFLAGLVLRITQLLAELPMGSIVTGKPALWTIWLFYGLLVILAYAVAKRRIRLMRISAVAVGGYLILATVLLLTKPLFTTAPMKCHVLAVGHGNAVVVTLPDGKTICYDAGSLTDFTVADRIILPFLRQQGINRIDMLFVSHPDIDHYCGVLDLCQSFPVTMVYLNPRFDIDNPQISLTGPDKFLMDGLAAIGQEYCFVHAGWQSAAETDQSEKAWQMEVFWPQPEQLTDLSDNDSSIVLRIQSRQASVLLCGDIGRDIQQQLQQTLGAQCLQADLLLLPHQGSRRSQYPPFFDAVNPQVILNSSAQLNQSQQAELDQLISHRPIYHTFEQGALSATLSNTVTVETFR